VSSARSGRCRTLIKELRLAGISTVEAANAWLPGFVED
jgi:hypothetical protein